MRQLWNKINSNLRNMSIKTKIPWYLATFLVLTVLCILVLVTNIFTGRLVTQKNDLLQGKMMVAVQIIEDKIAYIQNFAQKAKYDPVVQNAMLAENGYELLGDRFLQLTSTVNGVRTVFVVNSENEVLNNFQKQYSDMIINEMVLPFNLHGREILFSAPNNYPGPSNPDYMKNYYLTYMERMRDSEGFATKGYLVMSVSRDFLFSAAKPYLKSIYDYTYLVSKDGSILYRIGAENSALDEVVLTMANFMPHEEKELVVKGNTFFRMQLDQYPEWRMIGVISNRNLNKDLYYMLTRIALLGVVILTISIVLGIRLSKKITAPILNLSRSIQSFQGGEIADRVEAVNKDEVGLLIDGFNSMMDELNVFIQEIYDSQEEKKKAEISALKFQLELLQSQINPHFLYNTLNTVSYLAMKNRSGEIRELIQALNMLLRATISNTNEFITIQTELEFLKAYTDIQNYRYNNMIELSCCVDDEALEYLIPKLILQPIVENALLHGIFLREEGVGHVRVNISCYSNGIDISVADDGVGMDEATLQQIREHTQQSKGFNSIGLRNVSERLQLYYGEMSKMTIQSVLDTGTIVALQIPKHLSEENLFGRQ